MKTRVRRPGRRAGYTLIELMVVISGTVALISVGATTIVSVRRVAVSTRASAETGAAIARLHRTLRQDAAAAVDAAADETGLTLTGRDGAVIRYEAEGTAVRRTVAGPRAGRDLFPIAGDSFRWTIEPRFDETEATIAFRRATDRGDEPTIRLSAWLSRPTEANE
ncbi:MAG: prepilin-type N-terminal cleavage/methylation domain-containing protein [Planctomycetota bacterium]